MPFESSGTNDPLTRISEPKTSAVIEMLSGLQVLAHRWRKSEWKEKTALLLGDRFMESLKNFADTYQLGSVFIELAIDCPDPYDIPGFITWVREMDEKKLAFYLLGRMFPPSILPDTVTRQGIEQILQDDPATAESCCIETPVHWAEDIQGMRSKATALWTEYWDRFFKDEVVTYEEAWESGNRELEILLFRSGGTALYRKFYENGELPPPIPEDVPFTSIRYIPVYRSMNEKIKYYGYGNITIIYDCKRNNEYERSRAEAGKTALQIARAIGDERRLRILKLIAQVEFGLNGKKIAKEMNLSASVVSRHLAQLKKAGLITEKSEDNRNITYRLNWQQVDELSSLLMTTLGTD